MPFVLIRHNVEDYAKWKPVFDKDRGNREANGSQGGYLLRNADDPNELVVLLEWDDLAKARQFTQSEDLKREMQRAGVVDKPDIYFLEEAERPPA